jgi:rRNA maturation RNase YbeY
MTLRLSGPPRGLATARFDRPLLAHRARRVLREVAQAGAELSLALVDDVAMAELNERHRRKRGATDVLSFSLLEGAHSEYRGALLGDVVIDVDQAARQARRARRALDDELAKLMIHGVLHLLGHDHEETDQARRMRAEERRLWQAVRA